VGRLIRPLRLDELPQLVNVLLGDMSLVGPRPEPPSIVERYTPEQREVLTARPGLTGPTQMVWLDEERQLPAGIDAESYYVTYILPQKLQSDIRYVRSQSLGRDLGYLLQTPFALAHLVLTRFRYGLALARLAVDCLIVVAVTWGAYLVRFDGRLSATDVWVLVHGLPTVVFAYAVAFVATRTYRGMWRFVGVEDFWRLLGACGLGGVIGGALLYLMRSPYPRSVLVLTPVLAMLAMGAARMAARSIVTRLGRLPVTRERRRVVILGAGPAGEAVAREISRTSTLAHEIVGFVDDDPRLRGATLRNLAILGSTVELGELARTHRLDEVIIANPRLALADLRRIGDICARAGLEFKTLPSVEQLIRGEGGLRYLRKVNPDELLRRTMLFLDPEKMTSFLRDKRVVVTGAGGSIGSELCRQLSTLGAGSLLMVDRVENGLFEIGAELNARASRTKLTAALADVKHVARMDELFREMKPDVVFHAAAYKHVPILETHPVEAVLNNVVGTVRLARLAKSHGTGLFTLISSDKAVKPTNLMGATKRICELYMMALNSHQRSQLESQPRTQFRVVRFGNVLGSSGSALPLFQRQIENGGAITITHPEVSRFFMTIQEAVALVLESAVLETEADALVLDMGEPVKITDLADDLVTALGLSPAAISKEVVGLRPGEKLHEILWDEFEEVAPSGHPRLIALRQWLRPPAEIEKLVTEIEHFALEGRVEQFLARVSELVPSYVSSYESGRPALVQFAGRPVADEESEIPAPVLVKRAG
jgi:FlaA1/EpsC-like NDP-sugar epimerase